jgi:hypothetical protein
MVENKRDGTEVVERYAAQSAASVTVPTTAGGTNNNAVKELIAGSLAHTLCVQCTAIVPSSTGQRPIHNQPSHTAFFPSDKRATSKEQAALTLVQQRHLPPPT